MRGKVTGKTCGGYYQHFINYRDIRWRQEAGGQATSISIFWKENKWMNPIMKCLNSNEQKMAGRETEEKKTGKKKKHLQQREEGRTNLFQGLREEKCIKMF